VAVSDNVAEPCVIACADRGGEFIGGPGNLSNCIKRAFALRSCKFLFHLRQCRTNDVVMMNMRPDSFDSVEPHAMYEFEITWR